MGFIDSIKQTASAASQKVSESTNKMKASISEIKLEDITATITALASCITEDIQNEAKEQLRNLFGEFDEKALDSVTEIIHGANNFINKR